VHLSPDKLRQKQLCAPNEGIVVECILEALMISGIGTMSLSQQYETQQDSSKKVIYVH